MQDFRAQYLEQLVFLRSSAAAYDAGHEPEAKRLALAIRIMVHDTRHSRSLLTHLDLKEQLGYRDTLPAEFPPPAISYGNGLCVMQMTLGTEGGARFAAPLDAVDCDREHPPACFEDWWTTPILRDVEGHDFSRRAVVLAVANQDGGGHVDADLDEAYAALSRRGSHGFRQMPVDEPNTTSISMSFEGLTQVTNTTNGTDLDNSLALATVRQIAHELLFSLATGVVDSGTSLTLADPICPLPYSAQPAAERNDLCPCGSGRKFKKCFGRRQPRRVAQLPPWTHRL